MLIMSQCWHIHNCHYRYAKKVCSMCIMVITYLNVQFICELTSVTTIDNKHVCVNYIVYNTLTRIITNHFRMTDY